MNRLGRFGIFKISKKERRNEIIKQKKREERKGQKWGLIVWEERVLWVPEWQQTKLSQTFHTKFRRKLFGFAVPFTSFYLLLLLLKWLFVHTLFLSLWLSYIYIYIYMFSNLSLSFHKFFFSLVPYHSLMFYYNNFIFLFHFIIRWADGPCLLFFILINKYIVFGF